MKLKCRLGIHSWTNWSDPALANVTVLEEGRFISKTKTSIQDRFCNNCRKRQWRYS